MYTIEGFEQLTQQQIFDMSAKHMLSLDKRSMIPGCGGDMACSYAGTGCAASVFLTDKGKKYLEGNWHSLIAFHGISPYQCTLVASLQQIHDNAPDGQGRSDGDKTTYLAHCRYHLTKLASEYNLSTAVLEDTEQ